MAIIARRGRLRRVLIWEYLSAVGGLPGCDAPLELAREGHAMLSALVTDFAAVPDTEVVTLCSAAIEAGLALPQVGVLTVASLDEELAQFNRLSAVADWTLLVAPEIGGVLLDRSRQVDSSGGRLLGPSLHFIELASDKHRTAEFLREAGLPAPDGISLPPGARVPTDFTYPAVLKPRDGAGSSRVRYLGEPPTACTPITVVEPSRLERFCPGAAVSVAALCGPNGCLVLPACCQHLSTDGRFEYLGGSLLAECDPLARRAEQLATRAIEHWRNASATRDLGYIGIDLVLGAAVDGAEDFIIEINPRVTTSYVGLRAVAAGNLAEAMLDLAEGRTPQLSFDRQARVEFSPDGAIRRA